MGNGIIETSNDDTNKQKGGRPGRKDKADPWSVRVDPETRQIIAKAANQENKTLEEFFGTTLRQHCQELITAPRQQALSKQEDINPSKFVSVDDFDQFKQEILGAIQQTQSPGLLTGIRRLLFGSSR